jgi:Domain of unknown function (DUF3597)
MSKSLLMDTAECGLSSAMLQHRNGLFHPKCAILHIWMQTDLRLHQFDLTMRTKRKLGRFDPGVCCAVSVYGKDRLMGIFSTIKNAIFGGEEEKAAPAPAAPTATATAAPTAPVAAPAPAAPVDVEALMESKNVGRNLNWRVSIVDLMALLDMDHSLASRKELATELGYTGELNGSAEMNIWLHKQVMKELAANGGKVPADLLD